MSVSPWPDRAPVSLALTASSSLAQEDASKYPSRPIRIIVGFAAGGGNDVIARIYGQKLSEDLGQPVIVENKPGGGAIVATDYVAKAAPDGYTLLVGASGMAINQSLYAKLPYDSVRDFVAISEIASFPLIMIVNASSPIKSVAELVAYAKANADKTNYATSSAIVPARHRAVQAEDRRADAGHSLQERERDGAGGGLGPGDDDDRGCRPGVAAGEIRHGARARGHGAEADGGISRRADYEGGRRRCRRHHLDRRVRAEGDAARDRRRSSKPSS